MNGSWSRTALYVTVYTVALAPVAGAGQAQPEKLPPIEQSPAQPTTERDGARASRDIVDPTQSSVIRVPQAAVQLIATKEGTSVAAGAAYNFGSLIVDGKLAGPITQGASEATLLTLDSLANAASFEMGVGWVSWTPTADAGVQWRVCLEHHRALAKSLDDAKKLEALATPLVCGRDTFSKASYRQRFVDARSDEARTRICTEYAQSQLKLPGDITCEASQLPDVSPYDQYNSSFNWGTPWQVGARGKVGYRKLEWADSASGEWLSDARVPWEIGFGGNVVLPRKFVFGGEYRRIVDFNDEKKRDVCLPLATAPTGTTTCRELPFGKYKAGNKQMATAFLRKWVGIWAIDIRGSYDFEGSAKSFEVPFSFVLGEGKGVTAGVATGWTSDPQAGHRGWIVRAFVGDILKVWPGFL